MNEEEIFHQALSRRLPKERALYLQQACAGNPALRASVEALLQANVGASGFMEQPASALGPTIDAATSERPGTVIGPYKLLQQIGEGGMGTVYMAEQMQPVQRKVALKIIKLGMDSRSVVARFEAERQALALMDHPNIAKVLEAGTTGGEPGCVSAGRPYFVMELVKGVPITRYCDEHHLTPRERLNLFLPVCQAVQHAHQKGIIHRDLKPSNVLVADYDDKPVAKVIDFGVAKATGSKLTERTMFTEFGQVVGTLEYMSPEQAKLNALDIDTRSDIYALGVLLYELLTGTTPFDRKRLQQAAFDEMLRIIREEEPPKPSTRLSTTEALPSIAANRGLEPKKLSGLVRGELDWIVMKCLEKDRNRRYETANGLAMDLGRYLHDEPVLACPPSAGYRVRKLARRNKKLLVTTAAFLLLLILGVFISTWQAVRATQAEREARAAEQRAEEEAEKARDEAAIAKAVSDFMQKDLLASAGPESQPDRDLKVRTVLDRAAQKITGRFNQQPLVEAAVRATIGSAYQELGEYAAGLLHQQLALDLRRRILGEEHPDTLRTMTGLGLLHQRRAEYALAEPLYVKALQIYQSKREEDDVDALITQDDLAGLYSDWGRYADAEPLFVKTLEVRRRLLGSDHNDTLVTMNNLALLYHRQGKLSEAEVLFMEALEGRRRTLGAEHIDTLVVMNNLAILYLDQRKFAQAEPLLEKGLDGFRRLLGREHPNTWVLMNSLAECYRAERKYAQAEPLYNQVLEIRRRKLGPGHPHTGNVMNNLALLFQAQGKYAAAEALLVQVMENASASLGEEHPDHLNTMKNLAGVYQDHGKYAQAEPLFVKAYEVGRRVLGETHFDTQRFREKLAGFYVTQGRFKEAEPLLRECVKIREQKEPNDWVAFNTKSLLGASLLGQKKYSEAEPLLLAGYEGMKQREDTISPAAKVRVKEAGERLVQLYHLWGKKDKADAWRKKLPPSKEGVLPKP